jgi:serine phosphatase RsbU (regulator of sigma subunit)/HAMP domain-containing protein
MSVRLGLRSITSKLLVAFLAVFLPLTALQYVARYEHGKSWRLLARESRASTTRAAAATVEDVFEGAIRDLQIAYGSLGRRADAASIDKMLQSVALQNPGCIAAGLLDVQSGKVRRQPPLEPGQTGAALPPKSLRGRPAVSSISDVGSKAVFTVTVPVVTADGSLAVMYAVITTDALPRSLAHAIGESHHTVVIDPRGRSACRVGRGRVKVSASRLLAAEAPEPGQVAEIEEADGIPGSMAVSALSGWRTAVFDAGGVRAPVTGSGGWLAASIIVTLAALAIFFAIGNRIASPVRRLSRAAAAVAVGDLRRRVNINTGDELQSLAESFNQMAASLEAHERDLRMKTRLQQSLFEVTKTVTASLDLDKVAASIADALEKEFGAKQAIIFRMDEAAGRIEAAARREGEVGAVPDSMLRLAERALNSPGALFAPAPAAHPGSEPESGTVVALPLVAGSRRVGVLAAVFPDEEGRDAELKNRLDLLETFASCAAVAVQNAYIHGQAEELTHFLSCLRRVVEAVSSSLDLKQVLRTLVRTTTEVMDAKACAILLADRKGKLSVAEEYNLSKEFRDRLSLQPGERWSGVALAQKRPITRSDVASENGLRLSEHAKKEGLRGYVCAPLVIGDEAIGTINVWMDHPHEATPMETDLLTSIAGHAAAVIANAKLFSKEYQIAETLQSTLLGVVPDRLGRLVFGHKYLPALDEARVGGDLYDVVSLPNGKVALIVADVSGKGIQAAVHTAMIRHMCRAFVFQCPDSAAAALNMLNRALLGYVGTRVYVTMFCAIMDPATGRAVYANAGHPPAIALTHGGKQQMLFYRTGTPLGYSEDSICTEKALTLSAGDTLLLYTDGIIEARQDGRVLSLEGLQDMVFRHARLGPAELVEMICEETSKFANRDLRDDIAVVAARLVGRGGQ